jgi:hypothetical protein
MNDEQLRLMARILLGLCQIADIYAPYNAWGIDVGQCRFCGVVGEMHYPDIFYKHKPECFMALAKQLLDSLQLAQAGGEIA